MKNIDEQLELLGHLKESETPPFLLTRIKQQIVNRQAQVPGRWKWGFALASAAVIALNTCAFTKALSPGGDRSTQMETVVVTMNLGSSNNFYHE